MATWTAGHSRIADLFIKTVSKNLANFLAKNINNVSIICLSSCYQEGGIYKRNNTRPDKESDLTFRPIKRLLGKVEGATQ